MGIINRVEGGSDRGLQGAIDGGKSTRFSSDRILDLLDQIAPGRDLGARDTTDRWGKDISVEHERLRTLDIQEALDDQVMRENLGETPIRRGLPPCKRAKQDG